MRTRQDLGFNHNSACGPVNDLEAILLFCYEMNTPTHIHLALLLWQLRPYSKIQRVVLMGQMALSGYLSA